MSPDVARKLAILTALCQAKIEARGALINLVAVMNRPTFYRLGLEAQGLIRDQRDDTRAYIKALDQLIEKAS